MRNEFEHIDITGRDMLYRITPPDHGLDSIVGQDGLYSIVHNYIVDSNKQINDDILNVFYKIAVKQNIEFFLIDETEFKRFVNECLPEWMEKQRKNKEQ